MASDAADSHGHISKGKQRAIDDEPLETTPLLAGTSRSGALRDEAAPRAQRSLGKLLAAVFLSTLCAAILTLILLVLVAYQYGSGVSRISPEEVLDKGLIVQGPHRVNLLNITNGTLWMKVEVDIGVDAGAVMGFNEDGGGIFRRIWRSLGRWGVEQLDSVTANLSTVYIAAHTSPPINLASVHIPELTLPLSARSTGEDKSWLAPTTLFLGLKPSLNTTELLQFVKQSWEDGYVDVGAQIDDILIRGGALDEHSWRARLTFTKEDIIHDVKFKIPNFPGFPHPGKNSRFPQFTDFVTLQYFDVFSTNDSVSINAIALLYVPFSPSVTLDIPSMPFTVFLPNESSLLPVVTGTTDQFAVSQGNNTVNATAGVLPLPESASPLLSSFVSAYLAAGSPAIALNTPLLPELVIHTVFPGPKERPSVLRDVTIKNMHISTSGSQVLASGTVYARAILPKGIDIGLSVNQIWPDVIVFDGEVPDYGTQPPSFKASEKNPTKPRPLPDPLPPRAFGRIRPDDWLDAKSVQLIPPPDDEGGAQYAVTAQVVDVPLQVLPSRDKEFRNFVSKVIFGRNGALAGVQGVSDISAIVHGLPQEGDDGHNDAQAHVLTLTDLPFQGSFRVGRKGF